VTLASGDGSQRSRTMSARKADERARAGCVDVRVGTSSSSVGAATCRAVASRLGYGANPYASLPCRRWVDQAGLLLTRAPLPHCRGSAARPDSGPRDLVQETQPVFLCSCGQPEDRCGRLCCQVTMFTRPRVPSRRRVARRTEERRLDPPRPSSPLPYTRFPHESPRAGSRLQTSHQQTRESINWRRSSSAVGPVIARSCPAAPRAADLHSRRSVSIRHCASAPGTSRSAPPLALLVRPEVHRGSEPR